MGSLRCAGLNHPGGRGNWLVELGVSRAGAGNESTPREVGEELGLLKALEQKGPAFSEKQLLPWGLEQRGGDAEPLPLT